MLEPSAGVTAIKIRTDSPSPSVARAKYAPSSRTEGNPTMRPAKAVTRTAIGIDTQTGRPNPSAPPNPPGSSDRTAEVTAPMA